MDSEKIVILGANGMLGSDISQLLNGHNLNPDCFDLPDFDITNIDQLKSAVGNANIIVNCAAYTNVDKAESESEKAYSINALALENIGEIAVENSSYVLHISTDFVFDGQKETPYSEADKPNPINVYGQTKLDGENLLIKTGCKHAIIRVQWSYGKNGDNFIKKIIALSTQHKSIKVVSDQIGTPTATKEMAKVIAEFIKKQPQGLFHFAAAGYASRLEVAKFIFDKLNINTELLPCKSSEFQTPAKRPLNSRLCCDKMSQLLDNKIENWQKPLKKFLEEL